MNRKDREQLRHWRRLFENPSPDAAAHYAQKYMAERQRDGFKVTDMDKQVMVAGVHKARVETGNPIQVNESRKWLREHGYKETIEHSKHNE